MKAWMRDQGEKSHVRYLVAGCFNTAFSFVLYSTGILLGLDYRIANFAAWVISVFVAFFLASHYVFRKPLEGKRLPIFVLSNMLSLVASMAFLSLFIRCFSMNPILASVITIPIVVAVNFFAQKIFVFR